MAKGLQSVPLFVLLVAVALTTTGGESRQTTMKSLGDVVVPLFRANENQPFAIYRARSIRSDFQKRGFFKIGLLRTVVAVGLDIELARAESFSEAMELLPSILPEFKKNSFSLCDFSVSVRGENQPLLQAREVTPSKTRGYVLVNHVRVRGATNEIPSGEFRLNGPQAGEIILASGEILQPFKPTLSTKP